MFNYNHFYYFYLVVKLGGITNAAKHLKTSQSSISTQVKFLEEVLEIKLFDKDGRTLKLSSDGQAIFSYCKGAFETFEDLKLYLEDNNKLHKKKVKIGVTNDIEKPFISSMIGAYFKSFKKTELSINLHSASYAEIKEKFLIKDVDIAITSDPIIAQNIKFYTSVNLPVGVLINSKFGEKLKHNDLKSFFNNVELGLALPSPELKLRKEIDTYLSKQKIHRNIIFESNILATLSRSIIDGFSFGILPLPYVYTEIKKGLLTQISPEIKLWDHKIYLCSYNEGLMLDLKKEIQRYIYDAT